MQLFLIVEIRLLILLYIKILLSQNNGFFLRNYLQEGAFAILFAIKSDIMNFAIIQSQ